MALRHIILSLLQNGPMHGYRLREAARGASWAYPTSSINIYPSLHSLESDGFVAHSSEVHNGRARKTYRILDAGVEELRHWLITPTEETVNLRDQIALKIAMLSHQNSREARAWIQAALDEYRQEVDLLSGPTGGDIDSGPFGKLTREYGVQLGRLRVRYLEDVLAVEHN